MQLGLGIAVTSATGSGPAVATVLTNSQGFALTNSAGVPFNNARQS